MLAGIGGQVLLGDAEPNGVVDFADIPASNTSVVLTVELPPVVAPQFDPTTSELQIASALALEEDFRLPERQAIKSSTPLSLVGGEAGFESRANDDQVLADVSESDQRETEVENLLDETFATYDNDLDVVFG